MKEGASILLVDDNISLCRSLAFILERNGYNVSVAENGIKAVETVKEKSFDLIVLDIKMPLMDGLETYRNIKKIRPSSRTVMATAYAVEDQVQQALDEGAIGVIHKPMDVHQFLVLIEREIEGKAKV